MKPVLDWVKSNVISVIFFVIMVAAVIALPIVAGKLDTGVSKTFSERVTTLNNLTKLEKTQVSIPARGRNAPIEASVLVNQELLDRYREVMQAEAADANRVVTLAQEHNRKGRVPLLDNVFPEPPFELREVLPRRYWERLTEAYDALIERVKGGQPPSAQEVADQIQRRRLQFLAQVLQRDETESLDAEEAAQLQDALIAERMTRYAEAADRLSVYIDPGALGVPGWIEGAPPTIDEMFEWQWRFWLVEDLIEAVGRANQTADLERFSVQQAPVKRVVSIQVIDAPAASSSGAGNTGVPGGNAPGLNAPGMTGGAGGRRGPVGGGDTAPANTATPPNPSAEVKLDYGVSFTGRHSNPLYDVRFVAMTLIVDTARLPAIMDALAQQNFMTVVDMEMGPADQFAAARDGFFYGPDPVSQVTLIIETVWLRNWTSEYMPPGLRMALGVPDPVVGGEGG